VHQDKGSGGTQECQFYNREHSVPNNWFGGEKYPMYSDLFHLYPTDKYVNGQRADFPFGETNQTGSVFSNGSKKGNGTSESGYTGMVFEPIDEYKGDFARTYFYMTTRYININFTTNLGNVTFTYNSSTSDLTDYAINLFLKWHRNDPVSSKESNRNNAVYNVQRNRNPYIDFPELVEHIWGNLQDEVWYSGIGIVENESKPKITIIKQNEGIYIEGTNPNSKIEIYSIIGQNVYTSTLTANFVSLNYLNKGVYIVRIDGNIMKIVW
jgi:endonuclease I